MKKYIITDIDIVGLSFSALAQGLQRDMQFWRPYDQRGLNIF
jgi:hypothetical protein